MSDEDLPGDENPTAASEVPASNEAPAPDVTAPDATDPGLAVPASSEATGEMPVESAGWGAASGPVASEATATTAAAAAPSWAASTVGPAPVPPEPAPSAPEPDRHGRNRGILVGAIAGAVVGALVSSGVYLAVRNNSGSNTVTTVVEKTAKPASSIIKQATDIHAVIAKVEPATVSITVGSAVTDVTPSQDDSQFSQQQSGAAGSGFVISSDGYIVTNNHLTADANGKIEVTFDSGVSKRAKLVGTDAKSDLSVLKVDGVSGLPTVVLGNSSELAVGDDVVAIGNALALEGGPTVTRGIVSGLNRVIDTENGTLTDAVQTDAAINHGNSGGPLVNSRGQVIGIVDAIADPSTNQNVDFAIAIDHAKPVIAALKAGKKVETAYMGVSGQTLDPSLADSLKLKVVTGVVVHSLVTGSPADSAGIKKDDVIESVDNVKIDSSEDLVAAVRNHQPGEKISVQINRDGSEQTINVTLGTAPASS